MEEIIRLILKAWRIKMVDIGSILETEYKQVLASYKNPLYDSNTLRLFTKPYGIERKLMEEAFEVTLASIAKEGKIRQIAELADLMYTIIAYMVQYKISLGELSQEMTKRQK